MSSFNQSTNASQIKTSNKKVIVTVVIILLIAMAGIAYFVVANTKGFWPFDTSGSSSSSTAETGESSTTSKATASIELTKLEASTNDKKQRVITAGVKLNAKEEGYCILTLTNKQENFSVVLDESKAEKQAKESKSPMSIDNCKGWSIGAENFPIGSYSAELKFVGSNNTATTSGTFTLE